MMSNPLRPLPMLPLQAEIMRVVELDESTVATAAETARVSGKAFGDVLVSMGRIARADLYQAMHMAGKPIDVDKLAQMPKWDVMSAAPDRGNKVLAVAHQADPKKRFYVVSVRGIPSSRTFGAIAQSSKKGLTLAGHIHVADDFMAVILGEHRERVAKQQRMDSLGGKPAESSEPGVSGAAAPAAEPAIEDQSQLAADFDKHALAAYRLRASDIHITCSGGRGEVKFRIDGDLEHYQDWTEEYTIAFCQAVYNTLTEAGSTRGGFSASQRQDGAIERMFPDGLVRFRYAHAPIAPSGFDVTLRLIPIGVDKGPVEMADLGYSPDQVEDLDRMFAHSSGLIFFLGTTGSGKSTSMAAALEGVARAKPGKKIRTVEQPVEYRIKGAYQTSVARDEFIPMISQMMRMDPDYMMVGETRDDQTAAAVLQGARSGHLCVSTLHADGAPLAYDRLQGLGVPRQELASVGLVVGIIYQKLVQLLCPSCKISADDYATRHADAPILRRIRGVNDGTLDGVFMARENGCEQCRGRGVKGRTVCAEILRPTAAMLTAIATGDSRELWRQWRTAIDQQAPHVMRGRTSFEHAIHKMRQGIVSPVSVETEFRFLDEAPYEDLT